MPVYKNNEIHARLVRPKAANSGVFAFAGAKLGGMLALAGLPNAEAASRDRADGVGSGRRFIEPCAEKDPFCLAES